MKVTTALTTGVVALACVSQAMAQDKAITINSFGGAYEKAHLKCVIDPFKQETGAEVNIVTAYSADAFSQLRAQKAAPEYDVIHFSGGQEVLGAAEGLTLPLDPAQVPNLAELYDFAKAGIARGEGPAYSIAAIGLIYDGARLETPPTKWTDLLDPAYAEHVVIADISNGYGMLAFLMLNQAVGGSLDDIQPGLDAVAGMLDAGATVVNTSPEIYQAFGQGDAWIAGYSSDASFVLKNAGLDAGMILGAEGVPASYLTANLVAGRPNQELALKFIDMTLSKSAQECFAQELRYSPTNSTAELAPEVAADLAYGQEAVQALLRFPPTVIEEHRSEWVERWSKAISR